MAHFYTTYYNLNYPGQPYTDTTAQDFNMIQFILTGGAQMSKKSAYMPQYVTNKRNEDKIIGFAKKHAATLIPQFRMINRAMREFYNRTGSFRGNKKAYYKKTPIPKRNGRGMRNIIDPHPTLKALQKRIALFLEKGVRIQAHEASHSFRKGRSHITNAQMHTVSKHRVKFDLKNFFPSITIEILCNSLTRNHIFFLASPLLSGRTLGDETVETLQKEVVEFMELMPEIATFEGGLPQGSPLSPILTNIVMTEFDHSVTDYIRNHNKDISEQFIVYTRYVDDLTFSSLAPISLRVLTSLLEAQLKSHYGNSIKLNYDKIKYLKYTDKTFITGCKMSQDHKARLGHEKKKQLKYELYDIFKKKEMAENSNQKFEILSKQRVQHVIGNFAHMQSMEPDYADYLRRRYMRQFRYPSSFTIADVFYEWLKE